MAGRISNEQKLWNEKLQTGLDPIFGPQISKNMASAIGGVIYQALQQQSQSQTLGTSESASASSGLSTRGGSRAQKAKAGRAGGKARARKLHSNAVTNGTGEAAHTTT